MRNNNINNLLNLKGVFIKNIENNDNNIIIHVQAEHHECLCPHCGSTTSKIKDYHSQIIKDAPIQFKNTYINLKKVRYYCKSCNKSFYEKLDFLAKHQRTTNRLLVYIYDQLTSNKSMTQIAKESNVSINKVMMNLSGNTGYYKYQVSLIDSKNHKILDILPCRYKHELCTYFRKYSYEERCKVKYFISDLWETYKDISMTYFPKAKIVADRFHYFRYINNALNDVRKEVQKNLPKSERKYFFRSRKLFLSKKENLSEEQIERLEYILINYSEDLRIIYSEKETLLNIIHSDNTENAIYQLNDWIKRNSTIDIPKLNEVAKTYLHWSYEIKNSLEVPYSNGVIEGFNNKIKTLKRIAFGFKNFKRFRTRILLLD